MNLIARPSLPEAAQRELDLREQLWPREIFCNRATQQEADTDLSAWRDILDWTQGRAQLLPAAAFRLEAILSAALTRRCQGMVPLTDPRHDARAQRMLDTQALDIALTDFISRQGWPREEQQERMAA